MLSDRDVENLVQRLSQAWYASMDCKSHLEDHAWVQQQRRTRGEWEALRRKIAASTAIWALPLLLGFLAVAGWEMLARNLASIVSAGG